MNWYFLIAGVIALLAVPVHIWGGESTLKQTPTESFPHIPNGNSNIAKQEIRFGWHLVSVDLLLAGLVLVVLAVEPINLIAQLLAIYFVGYSLVIAVLPLTALRSFETLLRLPQWILTLTIAVLVWVGTL